MVTRDTRFKLVDGYNLQIGSVRIQDAGDYVCQIGDQEARDQVHTVEILVPPSVRPVPQNGQITARKASTVTLECKASGNPVPNLFWHKKVREIKSSPQSEASFPTNSLSGCWNIQIQFGLCFQINNVCNLKIMDSV